MLVRAKVEVTLTASTTVSVLMLKAATGHPFKLLEVGCSFRNGLAADEAVAVEVSRASTDGTAVALTLFKLNDNTETIQTTGTETFTVEPTLVANDLFDFFVSPAPGGGLIWTPPGEVIIPGGGRAVIRTITQAGVTPTARFYAHIEE